MAKNQHDGARAPWMQLWAYRRLAYAAYALFGVLRIPARTGFHLVLPACDVRLTSANFAASLTKMAHVILFGFFFLLTIAQFDRVTWKAIWWSLVITVGLGVLIELEEGATRTGYCRMTDVAPDLVGALIALVPVLAAVTLRRAWVSAATGTT